MMARKSVCLRMAGVLLWLTAMSIPAGAQMWTQTDWSGGPGQLSWSDSTMYYTGTHEDGWRLLGDLQLYAPDDSTWVNTANLAGAAFVFSLIVASDGALYAGTGNNGDVFKSIDAGTTWVNTGDLSGAGAVWSIIEASDGALYAGTNSNGDVFKSIDAGTTWVNTGDLAGATEVKSLIEASDGALYAGTYSNGDVFKSIDAGTTWVNTGDLAGADAAWSLIEASDGALYAGTGNNGDVFKSIDAGTTWVNTGDLAAATYVFSLLEASDGALYAGTGNNDDVFKSIDAGTTWVNTGDLAGALAVESLIETSDGVLYAGTNLNGDVFKSIDAGTTWVNTGDLAAATYVFSLLEASDGALYAGTYGFGDVFKAGYFLAGDLVSSVFRVNPGVTYGTLTWSETLNGQSIYLRVRTDTLPDMSTAMDWDTCPPAVNGQDISDLASVDDFEQYIQYRAELVTARSDVSPILHEVSITYDADLLGPIPDSAVASDGTNPIPGIDDDDYVTIAFDEVTNKPSIDAGNIDQVLALSGGHSWLDGLFGIGAANWNPTGDILIVLLSDNIGPPTVAVGDIITPDGVTITDEWGNPAVSPVVITGSFSPPGVEENVRIGLPKVFALSQNEPNPCHGSTAISYSLSAKSYATLRVYDITGRLLETLINKKQGPGIYRVHWHAEDNSTGVYFYSLQAGDFTDMKKMILLR